MYHCRVRFYLLGGKCEAFETIKEMPPLEHFTHEYLESGGVQEALAAEANVILVNLQDQDAGKVMESLIAAKRDDTQVILLARAGQMEKIWGNIPHIKDIWPFSMSKEETQFRFLRWQQAFKMEKDFWQTNHYFETAMNSVPNLIWFKDKNGVHKKVNDSFCKVVNKTKQQVEGQRHAYIWDVEQDDPACIESEREVMEKKETCVAEETIQTGAGRRTLTTYKSPLYDLDGSVMGTAGVGIDITREREYEQEILQKNQTMEKIFTTLDCGVMLHTADGKNVISANLAALKILGYETVEEMMADGFSMIAETVMDEDKPKLRSCIKTLTTVGDSVSVEYRVKHKDGAIFHIMGNVKLLQENGQLFYRRFLLDCTEQKLQEEKNEQRQMELVHALSIDYNIVCSFDLDKDTGTGLRSNKGVGGIFAGREEGSLSYTKCMERYMEQFVHEEDREMMRQRFSAEGLEKELAEKNVYTLIYRVRMEGEIEYYQVKAVRTGNWGENKGVVLGFRSVNEEIRSEMEKKTLLENALKQANRANRAKSIFLSNMSHDIRTPMNAIVGFTNLAIRHIDSRDLVEEYLKKIMTSGNHLLSLINDVLDMSRIESGKIHLDESLCRLPDILHGLSNILLADVHAKQLDLNIDAVDIADEEIYCDKLRLNQVLLNLLGNAVKYTGTGGKICMKISEKPSRQEGYGTYEFIIRDTGIGMSSEFVSRIFEPFEREKSSTISGIQGTGLGMAITKNIVEMMHGTIDVKSRQGEGTEVRVCFSFRLHSKAQDDLDLPQLKNCRALVVDDDFNACDSVTDMLGQLGMRTEWTLSGKEALLRTHQAVSRDDIYNVYVIDWMLPDMNGIEVTRRIRKEMGDEVPIILMTAYDWADIEEEAKEAGINAFCSKPLFLSELRSCLHSIVSGGEDKKKERGENQRHYTGRILLAEDNELNQEIATAILGDAGFTTEVAGNGQIAVEMLKNSKPGYYQIVLMDVRMPVMNGYEATKAIRQFENRELASIPILAMTANAFEEDRREALRCGMNGHLAKPIDVEGLFEMLDELLPEELSGSRQG